MAWDRSLPNSTTKLRNLSVVIPNNWQAIDGADSSFQPIAINFAERNSSPLAPPNDPAAIANAYILYSKQDSAGKPALFGIDEDSTINQFTDSRLSKAANGYAVIPPGLLLNWGTATMLSGTQTLAVAFNAASQYSAAPYVVFVQPYANTASTSPCEFGVVQASIATTGFTAQNFGGVNVPNDVPFGWLAIGAA